MGKAESGGRRVCLGCRTVLGEGETCGEPKRHVAVALEQPKQRKKLDDEVWGPDSRARKLRNAAKAGASGGLVGGSMQGCGVLDGAQVLEGCGELANAGEGIVIVLVVLVAAAAGALVVWLSMGLVKYVRRRLDRPKPHGALRKPPRASGVLNGAGAVTGDARIELPWTSGSAVAYAFELHARTAFGGGAMLRDATTAGFDVTLDDGRLVRVPPGDLRIVGKLDEAETERARVDAYLSELDPRYGEEGRSLFPYDHARALSIAAGDRVEVLGELAMTADDGAPGGSAYRASAGLLAPVGVAIVRVLPAATPLSSPSAPSAPGAAE